METSDKERIKKLKKLARSFFGQGAVGHAPNPDSDFEYAWKDYLETGMLCPWRTHRSDWEDEMRVDELLKDSTLANQQLADQAKIASLKEALTKAGDRLIKLEDYEFYEEIENLLK